MKKLCAAFALLFLLFGASAQAAGTRPADMTASGAIVGTQIVWCPIGTTSDLKCTFTQVATFINSLFSGDCTATAGGALTCTKTNGTAFGSLATVTPGTGVATWATTPSSANLAAALTDETGTGAAVFANSPTLVTPALGTPASAVATNFTGTAASLTAGTATNAVNTGITDDTSTAATMFPTWVTANTGNLPQKTTSTKLTFNPSTGVLSSTSFTGAGTGLTGTAASLTAGNVTTNANLTGAITSAGNATSLGSFTSANLSGALTDETGSGAAVFGTAPTISSANLTTAAKLAYITGSTQCLNVDTTGAITGTGAVCGGSGSSGANPTATASDTAVNGVASTFMRSDAAPAVQKTSASVFGLVKVDGTTITASAGVISAPPIVNSRTVSGTTDTILSTDLGNVIYYSSASSVAITQPAPSGSFAAGFFTTVCSTGAGTKTITPGSGNIGGAGTKAFSAGSAAQPICLSYQSDGTNFNLIPGYNTDAAQLTTGTLAAARGGAGTINGALKGNGSGVVSQAACADLSNGATGCSTATGTSGATIPLLNGTNTFSGAQTFGEVIGTVTTQSGTTYTLASTDCGTTVRGSNASAITFTIPQGLPVGCNISVEQALAGQVAVNGSAVTPATLHSAHSFTKTSAQWAIINVFIESSNVAILTGDGA